MTRAAEVTQEARPDREGSQAGVAIWRHALVVGAVLVVGAYASGGWGTAPVRHDLPPPLAYMVTFFTGLAILAIALAWGFLAWAWRRLRAVMRRSQ